MKRPIRRFIVFIILVCVLLIVGFLHFRSTYQDAICALSETQVKNSTSDLINDAIDRQIEPGNIQYDRMVYFEKDINGRITALKTNMSEVNRLKTDVINIINDDILALDTTDLGIPFGSIFLPEFLSSTNTPTTIPGIALSGAFGACGPPRSVLHQPGSVRLIITSVPSTVWPRSMVILSSAALLAE